MNLIAAIKSGRPFRRKSWDDDMLLHVSPGIDGCDEVQFVTAHSTKYGRKFAPFADDLIAEDYELAEEPTVTITRAQFWDAVNSSSSTPLGHEIALNWDGIEKLARKLGLEDK